ncbi:hypothetical protein B0H67DRAFT_447381, partial [Lasiosphaeris hirsuta]
WNTRGWTYQERLCSHRLLVFADQQVVYLCGVAAWCEDTVLETGDGHMVDEYTSRNLTFPGDILDAFTGGLTRFEQNCKRREGIELESLFGLPAAAWKRRGLKWRHPSGVEVAFPSWSWMGW